MKVYKIRNAAGLYSTGGNYPSWSKVGKTWNGAGPLRCHLTMIASSRRYYGSTHRPYDGCVVVAFEAVEPVEGGAVSVDDFAKGGAK